MAICNGVGYGMDAKEAMRRLEPKLCFNSRSHARNYLLNAPYKRIDRGLTAADMLVAPLGVSMTPSPYLSRDTREWFDFYTIRRELGLGCFPTILRRS